MWLLMKSGTTLSYQCVCINLTCILNRWNGCKESDISRDIYACADTFQAYLRVKGSNLTIPYTDPTQRQLNVQTVSFSYTCQHEKENIVVCVLESVCIDFTTFTNAQIAYAVRSADILLVLDQVRPRPSLHYSPLETSRAETHYSINSPWTTAHTSIKGFKTFQILGVVN